MLVANRLFNCRHLVSKKEPSCTNSCMYWVNRENSISKYDPAPIFHWFNKNKTKQKGFVHEHTHPDRDDFINVDLAKVPENFLKNYQKVPRLKANLLNQPYDMDSVLHYIVKGVITTKDGKNLKDPYRTGKLSKVDVASILTLYADV